MSEMPERIFATDEMHRWYPSSIWGDTEYIRADIVAEKDAEIERLRKALVKIGGMPSIDQDDAHRLRAHARLALGIAPSDDERASAAYLRERDSRPPGGEA